MLSNHLIKDRGFSEYKKKVLTELESYAKNALFNPLRLYSTEPSRITAVQNILNKLSSHDLIFLLSTLEETLKIENRNSQLRDRVGKEALSQLYKYIAGGLELFESLAMVDTLINQNTIATFGLLTIMLLTDSIETYLQKTIDHRNLFDGIYASLTNTMRTNLLQALENSVRSITLEQVAKKVTNIFTNVGNFAHANLSFFTSFAVHTQPDLRVEDLRLGMQ